jgi:hypothetical protein
MIKSRSTEILIDGKKQKYGKIFKGTNYPAYQKQSLGSIPSKYDSFLFQKHDSPQKFQNDKKFDIENKITNAIIKYLKDKEKFTLKIEKVIIFNNIKLNSFTIHFLRIKNYDYSIVGVFSNEINYQLSKLILFHIYVSIINLKNKINFEINEQIFFNLYYELILFPLIKNFEIKCNEIFKKKSINIINNFEYNTTLLIDLNTKKILINLISLRSDKKNFKIQNESQMFIEILYHSTNIQIEYNNENQNSINLNLDKFYVKFDCRSTYPRQTYIIRFIPFCTENSNMYWYE